MIVKKSHYDKPVAHARRFPGRTSAGRIGEYALRAWGLVQDRVVRVDSKNVHLPPRAGVGGAGGGELLVGEIVLFPLLVVGSAYSLCPCCRLWRGCSLKL